MSKFNPGLPAHVVAVPIRKLTRRQLRRAVRKMAKFFNVDNTVEDVAVVAEYFGYSMGSSSRFVFCVLEESRFNMIAIETPEIWDITIADEPDSRAVVVL